MKWLDKKPDDFRGDEVDADNEYDTARADYPGFDALMRNGMQNYLARGEVNDLVGFLNNPDNDSVFKANVLQTLITSGEPYDDLYTVFTVTRMNAVPDQNESTINTSMPSIFEKFDTLPLEKQLDVLSKIETKKIDEVYKKATQVKAKENKPKKRKPNKGHQSPHPYKGRLVGESVPDNTKIRMLNHLFFIDILLLTVD